MNFYGSTMENSKVFKGFSPLFFLSRAKIGISFCLKGERERKGFWYIFLSCFHSFMKNCWFLCMKSTAYVTFLGMILTHTRSLTRPSWEKPKSMFIHFDTLYWAHKGCVILWPKCSRSFSLSRFLFPFSSLFQVRFLHLFFLLLLHRCLFLLCLLISKQHFLVEFYVTAVLLQRQQSMKKYNVLFRFELALSTCSACIYIILFVVAAAAAAHRVGYVLCMCVSIHKVNAITMVWNGNRNCILP